MASLGSLVIELAANTARLQGDLGRAATLVQRTAQSFKSAFAFLGVGAGAGGLLAAFGAMTREAANFGDEIQKAAARAGLGAGAFSELAAVAKKADVEISTLSLGIKNYQVKVSEAAAGSGTAARSFAELGISLAEIRRLKPDQQLGLIADQLRKIADPADRARLGGELFGRTYLELVPILEKGAAGIKQLREEQVRLGNAFSDQQIEKLSKIDDNLKGLDAAWKSLSRTLVSKAAPALSAVFGILERGITTQEESLESLRARLAGLESGFDEKAKEELRQQIALLERRNALRDTLPIGTPGQQQKRFRFPAVGVDPEKLAKERADAAKKAAKEAAQFDERFKDMVIDGIQEVDRLSRRTVEDSIEHQKDLREAFGRTWHQRLEGEREVARKLKEINEELLAAKKQRWMETWGSIFQNWYLGGQRTARNLFKAIISELLSQQVKKGLSSIFDSFQKSNAGGGILGSILGGLFGGARATGGPVSAGKSYLVGERGPELFVPGASGAIAPNPAGNVINLTIHNDNRGASVDLIRALPEHDRRLAEQIEARVVEGLQRRRYDV